MLSAFISKSSSSTTVGFSIFIVGFLTQVMMRLHKFYINTKWLQYFTTADYIFLYSLLLDLDFLMQMASQKLTKSSGPCSRLIFLQKLFLSSLMPLPPQVIQESAGVVAQSVFQRVLNVS